MEQQFSTVSDFIRHLESLDLSAGLRGLVDARKRAESEFHDRERDSNTKAGYSAEESQYYHGNKKYYSTAMLSSDYRESWIKNNASGKVFLDYACGDGRYSLIAAKAGAHLVIGLDISNVSVSLCKESAARLNLSNTFFYQGDCEATRLPNDSVDLVLCSGVLHHLDLNNVFPELKRVMKPGGRVFVLEALDYNPFIKLYRWLTPQMRTKWESKHILSRKDVRHAKQHFSIREIRYWHLMSILATPFRHRRIFGPVLSIFNATDQVLLKIPGIRQMAWMFSFELVKEG